jgi:RNA polymerase sigma factor (TIGR02999 family)
LDEPFEAMFANDYENIVALARSRLARERAPVSAATLAHELFLNLRHRDDLKFATRQQFMAYSSRAMRSLLVDMARERLAKKRSGGELLSLTCGANVSDGAGNPEQILVLDEALERLRKIDERSFKVAEMRVLLGMEIAEVALAMGLSEPTVKRDWQRAKAYLYDQLGGGDDGRGCT